jgi:hypothetical protein
MMISTDLYRILKMRNIILGLTNKVTLIFFSKKNEFLNSIEIENKF